VIPDYQTIADPKSVVAPMTVRQKWQLFLKESTDPFTVAGTLAGASISQIGRSVPEYGADKEAMGYPLHSGSHHMLGSGS
jgi:hypothetical protein